MHPAVNLSDRLPVLEVSGGCIVSKLGDVTIGLKIEKPEIFTLGEAGYTLLHETFVKAMKLLTPGTVVHLQDIYWQDRWQPAPDHAPKNWLAAASDRFFTGRPFLRHTAYIYVTRRPAGRSTVNSAASGLLRRFLVPPDTLDAQTVAKLQTQVRQFGAVLKDSGLIRVQELTTEELVSTPEHAGLIERYCYLLDGQQPVLCDISFKDGVRIGNRETVIYTLADAEHVPAHCSPAVPYGKYSSDQARLHVGFLSGLGLLLPCSHIVNQYVVIGDGPMTWQRLERKRLRMQSLSRYSRSNALAAASVGDYLNQAVAEQRIPVRIHVNVMAWADHVEQLPQLHSGIVSAIAGINAVPHQETVGAPQLWWAAVPGNAGDLPDNECWDSLLEQACCFISFESNYRDSESSFVVRLGDRLTGRPVHVDLDIEPKEKGWIQHNNLYALSGTGGGKSFAMCHLSHTFHTLGGHVLFVDVGHSYSGLCRAVDGKYFTYTQDHPLAFNPFNTIDPQDYDFEKREALKSLLMALWKKPDQTQYRSEYVALSDMLDAYYQRLKTQPKTFPCFNTFYEFLRDDYSEKMRQDGVRQKEFDLENFLYVVRPYYKGGEFDFLLNSTQTFDLLHERLVVFELDRIKDHPILLPVVSLVIAELFLAKTRKLVGVRKLLVIDEAWKAIANAGMATNIREWEKTVRKYMAKIALVSQELDDLIDSPILKTAVLANSDIKILLDQSKFQNRFTEIQSLLGLTDKQKAEILSINRGHDPGRPYKDLWIGLGPTQSHVYRLEVSPEEFWVYSSDQAKNLQIEEYVRKYGSYQQAIEALAADRPI